MVVSKLLVKSLWISATASHAEQRQVLWW